MNRYLVLRKKNSKRYSGAIPLKKGTRVDKVRSEARKRFKGFSFRILTETELKKLILKQKPRRRK